MSAPMISIVTPVFNAARTLDRMFASVAAQSSGDWEHLVVIDGASDDSETIARAAAVADPRISVLVQANAGASVARNTGLAAARGRWVLFLDADDTIDRDHLKSLVARGEAGADGAGADGAGADIVCSGYVRRDADGRVVARYNVPPLEADPFRTIVGVPPTAIHAVLARRDLLIEVGAFDPGLRTNEDWDLWLRVARSGARFANHPGQSASYWNSETSLTRDSGTMVKDVATVMARARTADPRVPNPLPAYADGLSLGDLDQNLLSCALWSGAAHIGSGGDGMAALDALPPTLGVPWHREALVGTTIEGLMVGSGASFAALADRWDSLAAKLVPFLARVRAICGAEGLDFALMRDLEADVARNARFSGSRMIGSTLAVALTPAGLFRPVTPPSGAEALVFVPTMLPRRSFLLMTGAALAPLSAGDVRAAVTQQVRRKLLRGLDKLAAKSARAGRAIDLTMAGIAVASRLPRRLRKGRDEPEAIDADAPIGEPPPGEGSREGWDAFFGKEDPWNYGSPYEQLKYEQTIAILPDRPIGRALELACAEGLFTERLAPLVGTLHATDISALAIARAGERCRSRGLDNVDFAVLDFFNESIGGPWDLIVSSEVLYYMGGAGQLDDYAARVEAALAPDGLFVHAHAYEVTDEPDHTGFDWGDPFGAQTISRTFRARPGLERVKTITTDLYIIELYRRIAAPVDRVGGDGDVITMPMAGELDVAVAASVVWNGAIRTRQQVEREERAFRVPVLMYHRVADDGPAGLKDWRTTPDDFDHQLRFLRRRGYRSLGIEEWDAGQRHSASIRGRPILITFDDAYTDFYDTAWPILERNGFSAHVFVVTGKVGKTADWDVSYGDPAPLMDWDQIIDLHGRGASFGSHLDTHRAADRLAIADLQGEASRSRAMLEDRLGVDITTVAPPFGAMNTRVEDVLIAAGYGRIFDAEGGIAPVWGNRRRIPRMNVGGHETIEDFATMIGAVEPPTPADRP